jgi:hypothetical protein
MAQNKNSRSSVTSTQSTILDQGGIFFFYRPKVRSEKVESMESNDAEVLRCISLAIEQYLESIPPKLKPTFQQILNDVKVRKENLERSYK